MGKTKDEATVQEDTLLSVIGNRGKWQLRTFLIVSLLGIPAAWNMLAVTFLVPSDIDHWCSPPESFPEWSRADWRRYAIPTYVDEEDDNKVKYEQCKMFNISYLSAPDLDGRNVTPAIPADEVTNSSVISCRTWTFGEGEERHNVTYQYNKTLFWDTAVHEFELVCDRKEYVVFAQVTYMAGILLGAVLGGMFADRFGRRMTLLIFNVTFLLFGVATVFSNGIILFMILRFGVAFSMMALFTTGFVYSLETVGGSWRAVLGISYEYTFSIGFMTLAGIAWVMKPWVHLQLCIIIPSVIFLSFYFILPESPRWLLNQGREEEARKIIENICKVNGRPYSAEMPVMDIEDKVLDEQKADIRHLFMTPNLAKRTLNFYYNWFVNSFVYYGLSLNSGNLGGNVFVNIFIGGAVEIPAYTLSIYVLLKSGRRLPLSLSMVIGGIACLCTMAFKKGHYTMDWPIVTFAMIGKFCISASFAIVYVFSAEVFPTVVRTTGVGSSSMCARIGSIIAPFVAVYGAKQYKHLPIILFGATSIVAGLLALLLPETKGKPLPDTIEQGERFGTKDEDTPLSPTQRNGSTNGGYDNETFTTKM